jgi:hypothetical protein
MKIEPSRSFVLVGLTGGGVALLVSVSSNEMKPPGSPHWVAPRTWSSSPNRALPEPSPPLTSVGRPLGNPPPVTSSNPWTPVSPFGGVLGAGGRTFFLCVRRLVWASAICVRCAL